ncbi:hypothetical protein DAEQUDRAFT_734844 [Daedalea quercina L-15889]|uniref:Uncharacterized protein n=1 Tax=Daedalea quercina L-15889 TaxID=1314783 RepID=A0A165U9I8_9APHY|nr:hypothetical protein DAEQUDRAFT_734844 [Daedalea quercina L-15889]
MDFSSLLDLLHRMWLKRCIGDDMRTLCAILRELPKYDIYRDIPPLIFNQSHITKHRKRDVYLRFQVMEVIDTWDKLTKAKEREKLVMFIGTQVLQVREIVEHAALCVRWANRQVALRESERAQLKSERLQERKEGYTPLLQHKQVKVLTDRVWQNMREDLTRIVQGVRDAHPDFASTEMLFIRTKVLEGALKELVRCPKVQAEDLKAVDLALMPEIRHIMCAPAEVEVNKESFIALQDQLGGMVERWKFHSDSGEYSAPWDPSNGADPLELATTMFRCTGTHCNGYHDRMVFYPNVLRHACIRDNRPNLPKSDLYGNFILDEITWWRLSLTQTGIHGHYPLWNDGRLSAQKPTEKALTIIKLW